MASGIYNLKRDFQVSELMQWHKLTTLAKPTIEHFPEIKPMPLTYNCEDGDCKDMVYGNRKFVVPVAMDDLLPVAPPYCGETMLDDEDKGCEGREKDKRGTYILFTPREAWNWVAEILAGTEYNIGSIGMLWNRSFWFIGAELTELKSMSVGDGRESRFNLNFSGGLDRSVSPQCELSSILPVCHNTISLSRASGKILFHERATKHFSDRLQAAKSEIEKAVGMTAVFKAAMDSIAQNPCTQDRARNIFAGYLADSDAKVLSKRTKNAVDELTDLHKTGLGNRGETEFDLLNAYTQKLTRGTDTSKVPLGRRFASAEFGNNADSKADFMNLLTTTRIVDGNNRLEAIEAKGRELVAASAAV